MSSSLLDYWAEPAFADRLEREPERGVDVVIPVIHTNFLWRKNLLSIYREIPVKRLLLGDGGVIDDTLAVAREFPRVVIEDHRSFTSLGYSIRKLIEAVETDWFVYLHSDVFLPPGWFDAMAERRGEFDWMESRQHLDIITGYPLRTTEIRRAYSGAQMGRRAAFEPVLRQIDDDYLYRNEDIIIAHLLERAGGRYGKVPEAWYRHQLVDKEGPWKRKITNIQITVEPSREEDIRQNLTYAKGIIKYMHPKATDRVLLDSLVPSVRMAVDRAIELGGVGRDEFIAWVGAEHPEWLHVFPDHDMPLEEPYAPPMPTDGHPYMAFQVLGVSAPALMAMRAVRVVDQVVRGRLPLSDLWRLAVGKVQGRWRRA